MTTSIIFMYIGFYVLVLCGVFALIEANKYKFRKLWTYSVLLLISVLASMIGTYMFLFSDVI